MRVKNKILRGDVLNGIVWNLGRVVRVRGVGLEVEKMNNVFFAVLCIHSVMSSSLCCPHDDGFPRARALSIARLNRIGS